MSDIQTIVPDGGGLWDAPPIKNPVPTPPKPAQPANPKPPVVAPVKPATPVPNLTNTPPQATPPQMVHKPPIIRRAPLVWENTQGLLSQIEKELNGRVITYFVAQGWSIVQDDVKYFYSQLKKIGRQENLYFILVSDGGSGMSAWRIASLFRDFCTKFITVIPERSASAATMLCLAADEVIMTPLSYLTAVDTSIVHPLNPKDTSTNSPVSIELEEVKRAVSVLTGGKKENLDYTEIYKVIFNYIHPVALGSIERTKTLSENLCSDILDLRNEKLSAVAKKKLIDQLNTGYPSHGYPIPKHKARELGLNVKDASQTLNDLLWELINTYRYLTEPTRTDLSDVLAHTEQFTKIIESVGSRIAVQNTLERKIDPVIKGWTTMRNDFRWKSFYVKEENGEKKVMESSLEF